MTLKKFIHYALFTLALPLGGLVGISCQENEEVGEYDNWQARNQHYVDSIAYLADTGTDGWSKIVAFNLVDEVESLNPNNNHYIYIQKIENGTGTRQPEFNDSIRVHYLARLIPSASYPQGYIYNKTYSTYTFNEATDVPTLMGLNQNMVGFVTAAMHMVEGDRWKIVVPHILAYGPEGFPAANIPGYSALIFDAKLARIYKYKIDTDTTWH